MDVETLLAFSTVAWLSILSPGPAVLLALRNGAASGLCATVWSSLGNVIGIFVLSAAAMLGLGALLFSSAFLFALAKVAGALYLFYLGLRHLYARSPPINHGELSAGAPALAPLALWREGFLLSVTNPKPILFFSALFPQFLDPRHDLLPQFLVLTALFMLLSFITLLFYGATAGRVRIYLAREAVVRWVNRAAGTVFIAFGAALLTLRRPLA
jgi:homoserine/homoserine lactone efflux protein